MDRHDFGFTRGDVTAIREAAAALAQIAKATSFSRDITSDLEQLHSIADRIEALLPPERAV